MHASLLPSGLPLQRRAFLGQGAQGIGMFALASLLNGAQGSGAVLRAADQSAPAALDDRWTGVVQPLHFPAKAKRVIFLVMAGGCSHLETFDNRPKLAELHGQPMPESFTKGQPIAQLQGQKLTCFGPQHPFQKHGQSGTEVSAILPNLARMVDDMCVIRSIKTEAINHDPAHTFMNTGSTVSGRPSMGSWWQYGLGAETDNLPGFVVLVSEGGGQAQPIAARQWHSGFLPSRFQGVQFQSKGEPVNYIDAPPGITRERQRDVVSAVQSLNRLRNEVVDDPEIATRIAQYEMAFRMQSSVPELMNFSTETKETLDKYGTQGADGSYAANCLLARRLAERGVRFVQLYHRGWDHHGGIKDASAFSARLCDQPTAALLEDLKQRDMLKDTLVVWATEFGRTPMAQGNGRDHHIKGFSIWMAGGGIKGGLTWGSTDELGYAAVENVVSVHDLHATMLHLMGIDHERLTIRQQGRDYRLTDVHGQIVDGILA